MTRDNIDISSVGDNGVTKLYFLMNDIIDGVNLSAINSLTFKVYFITPNNIKSISSNITAYYYKEDGYVLLTWEVPESGTAVAGKLQYSIGFMYQEDGEIKKWFTNTASFNINNSCAILNEGDLENINNNLLEDLISKTSVINTAFKTLDTKIKDVNENIENSSLEFRRILSNVQESENNASKSSKEASDSLDELKNTVVNIVNTEEGKTITASDCSNKRPEITIYGESKQNDIPTMDNPQEIISINAGTNIILSVSNKNLLQTPYTVDNKITATANKDDYNVYIPSYPFYITEGTKYTFSFESDGTAGGTSGTDTVQAGLLDTTNNIHYMTTNQKYLTFTAKKTGKCTFRYDINKNGCTHSFWNFMCEVNDLKTNYIDSEKQTLEVTLTEPLRAVPCVKVSNNNYDPNITIDGINYIADEICIQNGILGVLKRVDNIRLTSSDFIELNASKSGTKKYCKHVGKEYLYSLQKNALCTHFKVANTGSVGEIWCPDTRVQVIVSDDYDLETFKQFLDDNKVYIQLPLAEPIFTAFDDDVQTKFKAFKTYEGITSISNSIGAYSKVQYIADTKLYIDNKIKEVATAIVATESEV